MALVAVGKHEYTGSTHLEGQDEAAQMFKGRGKDMKSSGELSRLGCCVSTFVMTLRDMNSTALEDLSTLWSVCGILGSDGMLRVTLVLLVTTCLRGI